MGEQGSVALTNAGAEAASSFRIGKTLPAATKLVAYARAVKLPKCASCNHPHPLATAFSQFDADTCPGCGGPAADPCDERYDEADVFPRRLSFGARILRFFRKG